MVKVRKQLVSSRKNTYGGGNGRKFITIHETANTARGANAQAHANLQSNGFGSTWHYTVDDKEAIQSFPHSVRCWHAGDSRGNGNMNSIGIEICVNSDGNFYKAVQNAAELTKRIVKQEGIPLGSVVQHNHWSGKNCPTNLRNGNKGVSWSDFKRMVSGSKGKVSKGSTKKKGKSSGKVGGGSVVDYMKSKGMDSSFSNRKKLANKYGIKNYRGTASQNTKLLSKLKGSSSKKKSTSSSSKVSSYKGKRVESKVNGLRFYNKPSWKDKDVVGRVNKGYGFPNIVSKHKVGRGHQYKVKNSKGKVFYITASDKYVRVVSGSKKKKGKTIAQMADEVIAGKHGNGNEARRKSLGISKSEYEKVRRRVNSLL